MNMRIYSRYPPPKSSSTGGGLAIASLKPLRCSLKLSFNTTFSSNVTARTRNDMIRKLCHYFAKYSFLTRIFLFLLNNSK